MYHLLCRAVELKVATMKRRLNILALAGLLAAAAPAWAQAPAIPTSPNDPASKSLGWVETPPGSQTANPASTAGEPGTAPGSQRANPASATTEAGTTSGSQPASPAFPAAEVGAVPGLQKINPASGITQRAAAPRPKQPQQRVREEREVPRDRFRSAKPGDNMANQLNRQELGTLSTGTAAPSSARR